MTYQQAMEKLAALGPEMRTVQINGATQPRKFSLDHILALLHELGDPQRTFQAVLIAGTNGKGSTAATLASITSAAGIRTGLYTSPHLARLNERIKTSNTTGETLTDIPDAAFADCFSRVYTSAESLVARGTLPHMPSYFEIVTAVAFCWFSAAGIQLAVLEVGLGGRLDATNSVDPLLSIITDIGMDHMEYLGSTLREIAAEKAGILRQDGILVTLSQHPEANAAIGDRALALNVRGVDAARCLPPREPFSHQLQPAAQGIALPRNTYPLSLEGQVLHVDSPLAGQHQQRNIALAIAAALELRSNHGFNIPNAAIERGITTTLWPGRLEWFDRGEKPPILLDVAHNPAGAWTLRAALAQLPQSAPRTLIFSCLRDKQLAKLAQVLFPLFDASSGDPERSGDHVLLAPIDNPRAMPLEDLLAAAATLDVPARGAANLSAALQLAESITPNGGFILATGSVFLVGELRTLLT